MEGNLRVLEIENDQKNKDIIKIFRKTNSNNGFLGFWVGCPRERFFLR